MDLTSTEENYLKAIFTITLRKKSTVSTSNMAEALGTTSSSVTDMLKKLAKKNLVHYIKYKPFTLSKKGKDIAIQLIRKHRLWETFLVSKLGFNWSEVHDIAEQLEHVESDILVNKLDMFLGNPKYDPHGDPIPNEKGEFPKVADVMLLDLKIGDVGELSSVDEDDQSFLQVLNKLDIKIGSKLKVEDIISFDESMQIQINGCDSRILSKKICRNLFVILNNTDEK